MTAAELRAARERLRMTQAELAAALGMKSGDREIRRMESGAVKVSGPVVVAVSYMLLYGPLST